MSPKNQRGKNQKPLAVKLTTVYLVGMGSPSVYLIFGEDEYRVSTKAKESVDALVPAENQSLGLEVIDGTADMIEAAVSALDRCVEAIQTIGFLGGRKVVWFRDVSFLTGNVMARSETVKLHVNELTAMIKAGLLPGQILVITSPKVDKRSAFYKACEEAGEVHEFAVSDKGYLVERQSVERLREILSQAGLKMEQSALEVFLEKVGTDTRQMVNEIEKLAVFMGQDRDVQLSDVEAVTSSSRGVRAWDLADAFGKRDLTRALKVLHQLIFQKENPIGLVIGLENRIRDLMIYREALDKGWLKPGRGNTMEWREVPREVDTMFSEEFNKDPRSMHPYRVGLLASQAGLFSCQELQECRKAVLDAHVKLVSSAVPQPMRLELLLIKMLSGVFEPDASREALAV